MSKAENPGKVPFSYKKYYSFRNKINDRFAGRFYSDMQIEAVANVLRYGDTQPAVVVNTSPLLIAAYSDEMDAVLLMSFPDLFTEKYGLTVGSRLTTSCVYISESQATDIFPGENCSRKYKDFLPIVQLFIGGRDEKIKAKTALFDENCWAKVEKMGKEYLFDHPGVFRDGFSFFKK